MKLKSFFVSIILLLSFTACNSDISDLGLSIQPTGNSILIDTATFHLTSSNFIVPYIYSRPDSMLLGTYVDQTYGTLNADILTQLQPPLDVTFPSNAIADSAKLNLIYTSWFGDAYAPMEISVYRMDQGNVFDYNTRYTSNLNVSDYCSKNQRIGSKIFTPKNFAGVRPSSTSIEIPLSSDFVSDFDSVFHVTYTKADQMLFHKFFNGLYVSSNFGSASLLHVRELYMKYYYHFSEKIKKSDGSDSTVVINTYINYPANEEISKVNRFYRPNQATVKAAFDANSSLNLISSPANIYTQVTVPVKNIVERLKAKSGNKTLLLNRSLLRVDVNDFKDSTLAVPLVSSILMIKESEYDNFFKTKKLPSDSIAVLGGIAYEKDANNNLLYYYNFDMSKILTYEIDKAQAVDGISFILVPIASESDGSNNLKLIKSQNLMRAVKLCSATHPTRPMKLTFVFSGF